MCIDLICCSKAILALYSMKKEELVCVSLYSPSEIVSYKVNILHRYAQGEEQKYKVELINSQMEFDAPNPNPNAIRLNLLVDFPKN